MAVGDLMGQSLDGLGNLLKMPYGCGEQNMLNFAPDVYILKYLAESGQTAPSIVQKAKKFIKAGNMDLAKTNVRNILVLLKFICRIL